MADKIFDTVPMKMTLAVTYNAPIWHDDSDDLDVIAREEKAELQMYVDELVAQLGTHKDLTFTVEPVFEPKK